MTVLPLYAALGAFVASAIQAAVALSQMREDERDVIDHWGARDELRSEVSWTHPIQRWRRGWDIKRLIDAERIRSFGGGSGEFAHRYCPG